MKEEKEKKPARMKWRSKHVKFYAVVGVASLVLAVTIIATATALGNRSEPVNGGNTEVETPVPDDPTQTPDDTPDETPTVADDKMVLPVLQASVINDHGFFHNTTLGYYGHHDGVDFSGAVGEEVFCVKDGTVESIYKGDLLSGTEITVDHGDGLKTVYRFVEEVEGLKVGDEVKKGQKIATIAEANGSEYKDGAHLHLEVLKDGLSVDPSDYLPLADK